MLWLYESIIPGIIMLVQNFIDVDFYFGMIIIFSFMPEIALIFSRRFREWLKEGAQDGKNKLTNGNLKEAIGHYAALNSIRIYIIAVSATIFKEVELPYIIYVLSFAGAVGIESLIYLKSFLKNG